MKSFVKILKLLVIVGCSLAQASAQNRFSNDLLLKIVYQHSYNRNTYALLPYLRHPDSKYRQAAAIGFASVQDSTVADTLIKYLRNTKEQAFQKALLYSLGQLRLRSVGLKLQALTSHFSLLMVQPDLLIAIGKCAKQADLAYFANYQLKSKQPDLQCAYVYALIQGFRRSKNIAQSPYAADIQLKYIESIRKTTKDPLTIAYLDLWEMLPVKPQSKAQLKRSWTFPITSVKQQIQETYHGNAYHFIEAMDWDSVTLVQLKSMLEQTDLPKVLQSHAAELYINRSQDYAALAPLFNQADETIQAMLCERFENLLKLNPHDSAVYACLGNHALDSLWMYQNRLPMPRAFEAYVAFEKLMHAMQSVPYSYKSWFQMGYNIPIDWQEIAEIPETQKVEVVTNKGSIILQCHVNEAPASVANFLKLVDQGYYNHKFWHRMVPNFVVQGGCPRGDGWGNLDFVQRSEWSNGLRYGPGAVGLASAGKDSEGVQFFITHCHTPHLDGRYTIFAQVIKGQDVVNLLQVGDEIIQVKKIP